MARTARLEVRLEPDLRARVEARAAESGQSLTVFVERALEKALGETGPAGPSAAAGTSAPSRTSVPIPDEGQHHKAVMARQAKLNAAKAGKR